jgi:hypothetical protein
MALKDKMVSASKSELFVLISRGGDTKIILIPDGLESDYLLCALLAVRSFLILSSEQLMS